MVRSADRGGGGPEAVDGCGRPGCATAPSGPSTRLRIGLWMCSCGSWSRESCWKNDVTIQSCASTHRPAAAAVVADPGVAGVVGEVGRGRRCCRPRSRPRRPGGTRPTRPRPRRRRRVRAATSCGLERGVQHRDRLLNAERDVEEGHVVPGLLARLDAEFGAAFSRGVRLAFKRRGVQLVLGRYSADRCDRGSAGELVPPRRVAERLGAGVEEALVDRAHVLRRRPGPSGRASRRRAPHQRPGGSPSVTAPV